jgi:hypothetical protein
MPKPIAAVEPETKKPRGRKAAAARKPKLTPIPSNGREVLYPEYTVRLFPPEKPMTMEEAKEVLGWEEEPDGEDWSHDYTLIDEYGKRVRCHNNANTDYTNRPLVAYLYRTYRQEHLRSRWRLNGEAIIIGRTGLVLDAQHRLIGFVLACQAWEKEPERYEAWKDRPTYACYLFCGVEETDDVVNTINSGKPRSLADVIYRSHHFADVPKKDRVKLSGMADHALRTFRARTAADQFAFSPEKWTHAESVDLLMRHESLLKAIRFIHTESEEKDTLSTMRIGGGTAAALLYLMGASTSDRQDYKNAQETSEAALDFTNWDKAEEFWTLLLSKDNSLGAVRLAFAELYTPTEDGDKPYVVLEERLAIVVKAWAAFVDGEKVTPSVVKLTYVPTENGKTLAENPVCGGIDVGRDLAPIDPPPPSPEEVAERAKAVKSAGQRKKADAAPADGRGPMGPGDEVWVRNPDGDPWQGRIKSINNTEGMAYLTVLPGYPGAGTQKGVDVAFLQLDQPDPVEE